MSKTKSQPKPLENRLFGLIFGAIFAAIAIIPVFFGGHLRIWALSIAMVWVALAVLLPSVLTPLNKLWALFGKMMQRITNPILMGLVFFLTVVPTGLILKLFGKDPMRRKFDSKASSYWIPREKNAWDRLFHSRQVIQQESFLKNHPNK